MFIIVELTNHKNMEMGERKSKGSQSVNQKC